MPRPLSATSLAAYTLVEYVELGETEQGIPVSEFFLHVNEREWVGFSNCIGHNQDLFFTGEKTMRASTKQICDECAVAVECLAFAIMTKQDWGIWGGMSPTPRNTFRKRLMSLARRRDRVWWNRTDG